MTNNNSPEKRQEIRLSAQETLFIEVDSGAEDSQPATQIIISNSVDISANGMQVVIDRSLPIGSIYRLCLQLSAPEQRLYLSAIVAWVRALADDEGFAVGMQVLESQGTDVLPWKEWVAKRYEQDGQDEPD